jgi:hypothetical protein
MFVGYLNSRTCLFFRFFKLEMFRVMNMTNERKDDENTV